MNIILEYLISDQCGICIKIELNSIFSQLMIVEKKDLSLESVFKIFWKILRQIKFTEALVGCRSSRIHSSGKILVISVLDLKIFKYLLHFPYLFSQVKI